MWRAEAAGSPAPQQSGPGRHRPGPEARAAQTAYFCSFCCSSMDLRTSSMSSFLA